MAQRVLYPDHIEPLVQFVEETTPERIVAATHDKLTAGTSVNSSQVSSNSALWPGSNVQSAPTVSISSMSSFEKVW